MIILNFYLSDIYRRSIAPRDQRQGAIVIDYIGHHRASSRLQFAVCKMAISDHFLGDHVRVTRQQFRLRMGLQSEE